MTVAIIRFSPVPPFLCSTCSELFENKEKTPDSMFHRDCDAWNIENGKISMKSKTSEHVEHRTPREGENGDLTTHPEKGFRP
jgi:hypothetical protein